MTTKLVCVNNSGTCADSATTTICGTLSFVTASSDYDCDIRTNPGACYNKAGVCTAIEAACTSYNYVGTSADDKATSCQKYK